MEGWISIHREIQEHWIFQNPKYLKWWIQILLNVNHKATDVHILNVMYECKPGQSFRSIETWSAIFGCSKKTVINFFRLLEDDKMVHRRTIGTGNRRKHLLTVVNWEKYQDRGNRKSGNRKESEKTQGVQGETKITGNPKLHRKGVSNNNDIINIYREWSAKSQNETYKLFVDWFLDRDFKQLLHLNDHISEKAFQRINQSVKVNGRTKNEIIKEKIIAMEATADLVKKYNSFSLTLENWVKR